MDYERIVPFLRLLTRRSAWAVVVLFALGVAAATASFSVAYSVLLRPVPGVSSPGELVIVTPEPFSLPNLPGSRFRLPIPYPLFEDLRDGSRTLQGFVAFDRLPVQLATRSEAVRLEGQTVSPDFFAVLGVGTSTGRLDLYSPRTTVLSHRLWQRLFGGDPNVVGQSVSLNGRRFTVAGVAAPGFGGPWLYQPADLWLSYSDYAALQPAGSDTAQEVPQIQWMAGRLAEGATPPSAHQELAALVRRLGPLHGNRLEGLEVHPRFGRPPGLAERARPSLLLLAGSATLVLLITGINGGNLLLARTIRRRRELAVRAALGSPRSTLVKLVLAETLALSTTGALLGLGLAALLVRLVPMSRLIRHLEGAAPPTIDATVAAFGIAAALAVGLLTGLLPSWQAGHCDPARLMSRSVGSRTSDFRFSLGALAIQVALSLALLTSTVALQQTARDQTSIDPGFQGDGVTFVRLDLGRQQYSEAAARDFAQTLLSRLNARTEIEGASLALALPLVTQGEGGRIAMINPPGESEGGPLWVPFNVVGPGFFDLLGIPMLQGRGFVPEDQDGSTPVMVVSRHMAAAIWPGEEPLGKVLDPGFGPRQVVGVAEDISWTEIDEERSPYFYIPAWQSSTPLFFLVLKGPAAETSLEIARQEVRHLAPQIPLFQVGTLREAVLAATSESRILARVFGLSSLLALLLAALGVYALVERLLADRLPEISLRLALGGQTGRVLWAIVAPVARAVGLGTILGIGGAFLLLRGAREGLALPLTLAPSSLVVAASILVLAFLAGIAWPAYRSSRTLDLNRVLQEQ